MEMFYYNYIDVNVSYNHMEKLSLDVSKMRPNRKFFGWGTDPQLQAMIE